MKDNIKIALSVLAIVASAVTIAAVATLRPSGNSESGKSEAERWRFHVGDTVQIPGVSFETPRTVVIALRSSCEVCARQMPFYRDVAKVSATAHAPVVVASAEPDELIRRYLEAEKLPVDQTSQIQPGVFRISGVPTLMLVSRGGTLERLWHGALSEQDKTQILTTIRTGG